MCIYVFVYLYYLFCTEPRAAGDSTEKNPVAPRRTVHDRSVKWRRTGGPTAVQRVLSDGKFETLHVPTGKSRLFGRPGPVG